MCTASQLTKKQFLIKQVLQEREARILKRQVRERAALTRELESLPKQTDSLFSRLLKQLKSDLPGVRKAVNNCKIGIYDTAFRISEGNRQDKNAVTIRYIFRAIEVNPDMNWKKDMKSMRMKLETLEEEERQNKRLNKKAKSNIKEQTKTANGNTDNRRKTIPPLHGRAARAGSNRQVRSA